MRHDEMEPTADEKLAAKMGQEALGELAEFCAASAEHSGRITCFWLGAIGIGLWCRLGAEGAAASLRDLANYIDEAASSDQGKVH